MRNTEVWSIQLILPCPESQHIGYEMDWLGVYNGGVGTLQKSFCSTEYALHMHGVESVRKYIQYTYGISIVIISPGEYILYDHIPILSSELKFKGNTT